MIKFLGIAFCLLLFCSCGYRFDGAEAEGKSVTISVPFIKNDLRGHLNAELVRALTDSGCFDCVQSGGELLLDVSLVGDSDDRIGYRYDRNPQTGKLRDNIVGTENRRTLIATVSLVDTYTHAPVLGPQTVKAWADYDYVDQTSIKDLTFINDEGKSETVLDFSLGQLDSVDGAHDDASILIYRRMAQKIVGGLLVQRATDLATPEEPESALEEPLSFFAN